MSYKEGDPLLGNGSEREGGKGVYWSEQTDKIFGERTIGKRYSISLFNLHPSRTTF